MNSGENIRIVTLIKRCLLRWRKALLVLLISFLIGSLFSVVRQNSNKQEINNDEIKNYETLLKNYDDLILSIDEEINKKISNIQNSPISSGEDNKDDLVVSETIFVKLNDNDLSKDDFSKEQTIKTSLQLIKNIIIGGVNYNKISNTIGLDNASIISDYVYVIDNENSLNLLVVCEDEAIGKKIINSINNEINNHESLIEFSNIDISLIENGVVPAQMYKEIFDSFVYDRSNQINELLTIKKNLITNRTTLEKEALENAPSSSTSLKNIIKYGVVFGVVGLVIYIAYIVIKLLLNNYVLDSSDINDVFKIKSIAEIPEYYINDKKYSEIDKKIANYGNERSNINKNALFDLVANDFNLLKKNDTNIAIVGDVDTNYLEQIKDILSERDKVTNYIVVDNVLNDVEKRRELNEVDSAIIVSKIEKSKLNEIDQIVSLMKEREINIIGSLTIQ